MRVWKLRSFYRLQSYRNNIVTKTENIPSYSSPSNPVSNINRIPRPKQLKESNKEVRSSNGIQRIIGRRDNQELNLYNPINDSQSPMYSVDLNIHSIYPERKSKIRNIKAQINNQGFIPRQNMQYDNFFHLRNSPKSVRKY